MLVAALLHHVTNKRHACNSSQANVAVFGNESEFLLRSFRNGLAFDTVFAGSNLCFPETLDIDIRYNRPEIWIIFWRLVGLS